MSITRNVKFFILCAGALAPGGLTVPAPAAEIHVYEGESIQAAIDAAVDGDEIIVHPGTYIEQIDFLGKAIWLHSSDGPDLTTIDADEAGSGVSCVSGEGPDTVLDGFTITGGTGTLLFDDKLRGGGMFILDSFPTVTNCIFMNNCAFDGEGGGLYAYGPYYSSGGPTITDCSFIGNSAEDGKGGGVCNSYCDPTITNCTFTQNTAFAGKGAGMANIGDAKTTVIGCTFTNNTATHGSGGGMFSSSSQVAADTCVFAQNAARAGGGMYTDGPDAVVTGCTFLENVANEEGCEYDGGGMYHEGFGALECTDCLFIGNVSTHGSYGGGIYLRQCDAVLTGCEFTANTAGFGGGALNCYSVYNLTLETCLFQENVAGTVRSGSGGAVVTSFSTNLIATGCEFIGNEADFKAGALYLNAESALLTDCSFTANHAPSGGGLVCSDDDATLINCTIADNTAGSAAGLRSDHSSALSMIDCTITGNAADSLGGGIGCATNSKPSFIDCTIAANSAPVGAGVYCGLSSRPVFRDCTISDNTADGDGGGVAAKASTPLLAGCIITTNVANRGGGMFCETAGPILANCLLKANTAVTHGGGVACVDDAYPTVANCVLTGNTADAGGGALWCDDAAPGFVSSILWADSQPEIVAASGSPFVAYCDVEGGYEGQGNIDADPLFVDPENDDYHLSAGSPCVDAGHNWGLPRDQHDIDDDGKTCESLPVDFEGGPRFADDPDTDDTGCGVPVIVDMGMFEFPGNAAEIVYADGNGDGTVDVVDLMALLSAWGPQETCSLSDIAVDGIVDVLDLLKVLGAWGPCP